MLHLPHPHLCPACNGLHRVARAELPAAADIRPYFGTYIQLVERHLRASFTIPALSSSGGTDDVTFTAVTNSLGASGSGTKIITPGRAGTYTIEAGFEGSNVTGNGETMNITLFVGGVSRDTADTALVVGSKFGGSLYDHRVLTATDQVIIRFHTAFDQISGSGEMVVVFQPLSGAT